MWFKKVKRILKSRGISMEQLGLALDVKKSGISQKLNGKRGVTVEELMTIANILNMSLDELCKDDPGYPANLHEKDFMEAFQAVSPEKQDIITEMMKSLAK